MNISPPPTPPPVGVHAIASPSTSSSQLGECAQSVPKLCIPCSQYSGQIGIQATANNSQLHVAPTVTLLNQNEANVPVNNLPLNQCDKESGMSNVACNQQKFRRHAAVHQVLPTEPYKTQVQRRTATAPPLTDAIEEGESSSCCKSSSFRLLEYTIDSAIKRSQSFTLAHMCGNGTTTVVPTTQNHGVKEIFKEPSTGNRGGKKKVSTSNGLDPAETFALLHGPSNTSQSESSMHPDPKSYFSKIDHVSKYPDERIILVKMGKRIVDHMKGCKTTGSVDPATIINSTGFSLESFDYDIPEYRRDLYKDSYTLFLEGWLGKNKD